MNFVPATARSVITGIYNEQIAAFASALAEAELRAAGVQYVSEDDYLIAQYAVGPMREQLAEMKRARAAIAGQGAR